MLDGEQRFSVFEVGYHLDATSADPTRRPIARYDRGTRMRSLRPPVPEGGAELANAPDATSTEIPLQEFSRTFRGLTAKS